MHEPRSYAPEIMKKDCEKMWPKIVEYFHGANDPAAEGHLKSCEDCTLQLSQLEQMVGCFKSPVYNAPASLISAAKNIMQPMRKTSIFATLVRSNLGLAGVRSAATKDIQAVFDVEGEKIRVQYRALPQGWEILGHVPEGATEGRAGKKSFRIDEKGRFTLTVKDLAQSGFKIVVDGVEISVPAVNEADNGS